MTSPSTSAAPSPGPEAHQLEREALEQAGHRVNFAWLLRLRWLAIAGQVISILVAVLALSIDLPALPLCIVLSIELLTNLAAALWLRRAPRVDEWMLAALMALDVVLLTALLNFTGGPFNPFNFLYLVHIALAAVVLHDRWTWALVGLSIVGLGSLFIEHMWTAIGWYEHPEQHVAHMRMHLEGMYVAFGIAAAFIVYFVTRVRRDLALREAELARARAHAQRSERLASLATLAAGAAHELATPLSTIAVVAKELELVLQRGQAGQETAADAGLIRREVARCRGILDQLAADAGQGWGEGFVRLTAHELLTRSLQELPDADRSRIALAFEAPPRSAGAVPLDDAQSQALYVPANVVGRALRAVIGNALQASADGARVNVGVRYDGGRCDLVVEDAGTGMDASVLARAGEPFFTTKEPGRGMGLGLFLTRAVMERLGGSLGIDSRAGQGTRVVLSLPAAPPVQQAEGAS